eukprot:703315-Pelagomonas_calceolata.AAC.7
MKGCTEGLSICTIHFLLQGAALVHNQHQLAEALRSNSELRSQIHILGDELSRATALSAAADAAIDRLNFQMQHGVQSLAADQQRNLGAAGVFLVIWMRWKVLSWLYNTGGSYWLHVMCNYLKQLFCNKPYAIISVVAHVKAVRDLQETPGILFYPPPSLPSRLYWWAFKLASFQ